MTEEMQYNPYFPIFEQFIAEGGM